VAQDADQKSNDLLRTGFDHYAALGVPETPARFLGAFSDSVLDPYNGLGGIARMAKQGKNARALGEFIKEFGVGQGIAAGTVAPSMQPVQDRLTSTYY